MPDPDGGTTPLVGPLLSIQLNDLQLENHELPIQPAKYTSAADFACHQYYLLDWKYRLPAYNLSQEVAELEIFGLEDLKRRLSNCVNDDTSFVLTHTDLRPSNIIVDKDLCIQGIIDWEWAGTVPRQFFLPPTWLAGLPADRVSGVEYSVEYRWFRDVLTSNTFYRQLASEWGRKLPKQIDLPLAVTLRHHSCFVNIYYRGLFPKFYQKSRKLVVDEFFKRDGKDGQFSLSVQQRLGDSKRFTQYLEENRLVSSQRRKDREGLTQGADKASCIGLGGGQGRGSVNKSHEPLWETKAQISLLYLH